MNSYYHLAKLITRIDEKKFIENITVDQRHDLITRRLAGWGWRDSDDVELLLMTELSNNFGRRSIDAFSVSNSWVPANEKWII